MAGGGKTATSTSQVKIPPEVLARYNAVNAQAQQVSQQPFHPYSMDPNAFVAPLTPTQQMGIYNTNVAAGAAQPYYEQAGQALQAGLAGAAPMAYAGAMPVMPGQLGGQQIGQYMSPYLGSVVGTTMAAQAQQNAQQRAAMQGQAIQQGAFGGDRANIGQANLAYQQNLANSQTLANLMNQGYGQALTTAQQQQQLGLSAEQANRAALQQQAQNLYGMYGGYGQALAGLGTGAQQAALQGAQAQLAAGQAQQQTGQAGLAAMYNQFQQQQSYPFQVAQFLANIAMGTGALSGSTTTTTQPAPFFSDRRLKHDVHEIGKTKDGLPIYSFKYNGDDKTQIGLMAQDVEKKHPEAVGLAGGYKTVDYDMATKGARKADGGGLSSMGGAVGLEHAGLGFERGGYLGGGLVPAEDIKAILARQKEGYKTLPYGDSAFNVQGMPLGGGKGRVPLQGGVPTPSLAIPKQAAKPPESGMQQLRQAAGGLEDIEKLYGAGEKVYGAGQKVAQGLGNISEGYNWSGTPGQERLDDLTQQAAQNVDLGMPGRAYGGLIRAHREDGGLVDDKESQKDSGIDFAEKTSPDKESYGNIFSGKLGIPTDGGTQAKGLSPAQNPAMPQDNTISNIASLAKVATLFLKNGGHIPRHGYESGGDPQIDDAASWGEDRPNIYRTRGEEFRETRGVPQEIRPPERPDARISGLYDKYQEATAPTSQGLAAGAANIVPDFRGEANGMSPALGQRAEGLAANASELTPEFRGEANGLEPPRGRMPLVGAWGPGADEASKPFLFTGYSARASVPNTQSSVRSINIPLLGSVRFGRINDLDRPVGAWGVGAAEATYPTPEAPAEQLQSTGLAAGAPTVTETQPQYGEEPSGLIPRDMIPKKEVATAQPPQVATAPTGGLAGNVQQVAPESVTVRPGAAIYSTLVNKESGGNQFSQNNLGYSGLTQMGAPLLSTIGVYSPGERENIRDPNAVGGWSGDKWSGQFNIPGHPDVKTIGDFLKNKDAQNTAYYMGMAANDKTLRDNGAYNYVGQTVNGVPVTRDGLLMGAWLGGTGGVMRWLKGEGDPADANGTRISNYVRMGSQGGQAEARQPAGGLGGPTRELGDTFNAAARSGTPQAQAVDNAATQRGLAPPPPDATPQERGTWMQRNREWVLPLLGFLGKMASSQSRFALGAALEGLSGAAQGMVSAERVGQEQQRIDIQQQDALIRQNADLHKVWGDLLKVREGLIRDNKPTTEIDAKLNALTSRIAANQSKMAFMTRSISAGGDEVPSVQMPSAGAPAVAQPAAVSPPPTAVAPAPQVAPPPPAAGTAAPAAPPAETAPPAAPPAAAPAAATQPPEGVPSRPTLAAAELKQIYPFAALENTPEARNSELIITPSGRLRVNEDFERAKWAQVQDDYNIPLLQAQKGKLFGAAQEGVIQKIERANALLSSTGRLPGNAGQEIVFEGRQRLAQQDAQVQSNSKYVSEQLPAQETLLSARTQTLSNLSTAFTKLEPGRLTPFLSEVGAVTRALFPGTNITDARFSAEVDKVRKELAALSQQAASNGPNVTDLSRQTERMTLPNENVQPSQVRSLIGNMIGTNNFDKDRTAFLREALVRNPALPVADALKAWESRPGNSRENYIQQAIMNNPVRGDRDYKPGYLYVVEPGKLNANGETNTEPVVRRYVVKDSQPGWAPPESKVQ